MWQQLKAKCEKEKWLSLNQQFKAWHHALYRTRVLGPFRLSFIMQNDTEEAGGTDCGNYSASDEKSYLVSKSGSVYIGRKQTVSCPLDRAFSWLCAGLVCPCFLFPPAEPSVREKHHRETATFRRQKSFRHLWKVYFDFSIWIVIWYSEKNHKCFGMIQSVRKNVFQINFLIHKWLLNSLLKNTLKIQF